MDAKTVFISYNHGDSEVADKLKAALEKNGIVVRIDKAVMEPGEDIQGFIEDSIRETDATITIVSNRSLLSAWVALESVTTFYSEKFQCEKKFIACYIDEDFFKADFRIKATKQIDAKINEIDQLIPEYNAAKIDTNDLNSQKSRLYKLRTDLGEILKKLRESLAMDIRDSSFDKSIDKIVASINTVKVEPPISEGHNKITNSTPSPLVNSAPNRMITALKVRFILNNRDGLRQVIFGLEKMVQGDEILWKINFQLFERLKKSDAFNDALVDFSLAVNSSLNAQAERAASQGLTPGQSAHALGPAADAQKAAHIGEISQAEANQTTQDVLRKT
ncbi:MAG: toll/interleukin-1 receptor domain-containing protein [Acidobacteria bacterium]|nr:toll/interleukin-1 receptor domain-containing protein [Acidobacteriota bacterium]